MTPLAHRIVKELTLPIKDRTFVDRCDLLKRMRGMHCFDVTSVIDVALELGEEIYKNRAKIGPLAFLPAPKTWIEIQSHKMPGGRGAYLLEQRGDAAEVRTVNCAGAEFGYLLPLNGHEALGSGPLGVNLAVEYIKNERFEDVSQRAVCVMYGILALINTPRIVGRVTHLPHKGLERALIAKRQSVGHWPLHAWHEIKLSITPPDAAPGEIEEGHLTGKRALHFVRQHLRIRLGKLELVSAHWRGDAQLGIKRARYKVVA